MNFVCLVHDVPFEGLEEAVEQSDEDIFERKKPLICSPASILIWIAAMSNLEHDFLIWQDMIQFVEVLSVVVVVGAYEDLFYFELLFKTI